MLGGLLRVCKTFCTFSWYLLSKHSILGYVMHISLYFALIRDKKKKSHSYKVNKHHIFYILTKILSPVDEHTIMSKA